MHPLAVFGLGGLRPEMVRERRETIIAVNFGGCVIPTGLAFYELVHLAAAGAPTLFALLVAAGVNVSFRYCRRLLGIKFAASEPSRPPR